MKYGFLFFFLLAGSLRAQAIWYVDVHAQPPGLGTQAQPYTSIQYAHNQPTTHDGHTLLVLPGTYHENLLLTKRISVQSTAGPEQTTLMPAVAGPIVNLHAIPGDLHFLTLEGFTITGLIGPANAAAVSSLEGDIRRCVIRGNHGTNFYGVITEFDSFLFDCTVTDNDIGVECNTMNDLLVMDNTIVWGNVSNTDMTQQPFYVQITYCAGGPFPFSQDPSNIIGDPGMWSLAYHDYHLRPGSPCIDAGDPALQDTDGSRSDIGYYDYSANYAPVEAYCTGKLNSDGCVPQIAGSGLPSTTSPSPFLVTASLVLPARTSLLLYGYAEGLLPFQGGTLCLSGNTRRVGLQTSAGSGSCGGSCSYDFNARIQSGADPALVPGVYVYAQWYQRDPLDPAGYHSGLTNALRFGIVP